MIVLSKEQILMLHSQLISETGGVDGIRDDGLLESALHSPFQSFGENDIYPSIQQKAARLGFGLVKNHAFVDGNKRIDVYAMLVFLAMNKIELDYKQDELSDIILEIASGAKEFDDLCQGLIAHQLG